MANNPNPRRRLLLALPLASLLLAGCPLNGLGISVGDMVSHAQFGELTEDQRGRLRAEARIQWENFAFATDSDASLTRPRSNFLVGFGLSHVPAPWSSKLGYEVLVRTGIAAMRISPSGDVEQQWASGIELGLPWRITPDATKRAIDREYGVSFVLVPELAATTFVPAGGLEVSLGLVLRAQISLSRWSL